MKICWFGFLSKNHSWSKVSQSLSREFIRMGHEVHLFSTNGNKDFPADLKPNLKGFIEENSVPDVSKYKFPLDDAYDVQLSYTALKNFEVFFRRGNKNRFGIWNYETTVLPPGFARNYKFVDQVLPSSNFSKQIFKDNGIPDSAQTVVPHGIYLENFLNKDKYPLQTKKKIKFLANIAQPHLRKNIPGLLEAWGRAFTVNDDVCLILKISKKSPGKTLSMDVDFNQLYSSFKKKYKNHASIEIVEGFITDIEPLYNACDIVWTMSHAECWWLPGIEGMAANKLVIAPRYGGQLDFMNDDNSLLIDGKEIRADLRMQYWNANSPYAKVFEPNIDHAAKIIKEAADNYTDYHAKFSDNIQATAKKFTWNNAAKQIISLCK